MEQKELNAILEKHRLWLKDEVGGENADLREANLDFSQLNLSCKGLNFKIDEKIAKQIAYHLLNLMKYSDIDTNKVFKKSVVKWVNSGHLISEHNLDKIQLKEKD